MLNSHTPSTSQPLPVGSAHRMSMNSQHAASIAAASPARRARGAHRVHGRSLALRCHESFARGINNRAQAFPSR